jgi:plastocyanin domain-containing protein
MKKIFMALASLGIVAAAYAQNGGPRGDRKMVKVEISEYGFKPAKIKVEKGMDLVLMVTRTTDETCMKELKKPDGSGRVELPLNKEVKFEVGRFKKTGEIQILCGMNMQAGVVQVK